MNQALADLIAAFKALEQQTAIESAAVLMDGEGFDVEAIRVLGAWVHSDHKWKQPKSPCPDNGRATRRSYEWMVSGMTFDYHALADTAGVSASTARQKLARAIGARMIYADGTLATSAKVAMQAALSARAGKRKPDGKDKKADKKADKPAESN